MSAGEDLVVQTEAVPEWTLADRLRKALEHASVSGAEMAEYLEVHRNTVSNWIYGHARPPASAVKLWAMRCGVPYKWLVGEESASGSNITRIMGDQPIDNEITSHARRIDALREQLHGPSRRGPIRRSPLGDTSVIPSAVQASGG